MKCYCNDAPVACRRCYIEVNPNRLPCENYLPADRAYLLVDLTDCNSEVLIACCRSVNSVVVYASLMYGHMTDLSWRMVAYSTNDQGKKKSNIWQCESTVAEYFIFFRQAGRRDISQSHTKASRRGNGVSLADVYAVLTAKNPTTT